MNKPTFTVHQLNEYVKGLLHRDPLLSSVQVRGEISNFKGHSSGHMYFTLKDAQDRIRCVFFKQNNGSLTFMPQDGMAILAKGRVSLYGRDGQYQFYVDALEQDGLGSLHLAFEALKLKLKEEGLFDPALKKPLPPYPTKIAIVTSHTGAALRDILKTINRRNPAVSALIVPVLVQGPEAAGQISRALDYVNTRQDIDLIIIGRGGGSIEELWAFNEEVMARAIFRSRIPVISAVGHETDVTIADFAADVRAATPTGAAELAVPEAARMHSDALHLKLDLQTAMQRRLDVLTQKTERLAGHYVFKTPQWLILQHSQTLDTLLTRLDGASRSLLSHKGEELAKAAAALEALSPVKVLSRGYSVPLSPDGKRTIRTIKSVKPGDVLRVLLRDGQVRCRVEKTEENTIL